MLHGGCDGNCYIGNTHANVRLGIPPLNMNDGPQGMLLCTALICQRRTHPNDGIRPPSLTSCCAMCCHCILGSNASTHQLRGVRCTDANTHVSCTIAAVRVCCRVSFGRHYRVPKRPHGRCVVGSPSHAGLGRGDGRRILRQRSV